MDCKEITINGVKWVKKSDTEKAQSLEGLEYCIVRTYSAGVFAGYLKSRNGQEAEIVHARRLWYWSGAASLSQLAAEGVKNPKDCKFPNELPLLIVTQAIEIILCSEKARLSIMGVPVWKV